VNALSASLVAAFVTFVLTGIATYVTTRRNLQLQFDASLRDLRIGVYKKLWTELQPLAKYSRAKEELSFADARRLSAALRTWYFEEGGLFLSGPTRSDYFALQDGLLEVTGARGTADGDGDGQELTDAEFEFLRVLGSRVRTGMTRDVGTRRTFVFRRVDAPDRLPATPVYREEPKPSEVREKPRARRLEILVSRGLRPSIRRPFGMRPSGLLVDSERIGVPDEAWDPVRMAVTTARIPDRGKDRRILLIDDDLIIEGPKGWAPRSQGRPGPVLWKRGDETPEDGHS
jgi:hypothetical protein